MFDSLVFLSHHKGVMPDDLAAALDADGNRAMLTELIARGALGRATIYMGGPQARTFDSHGVAIEVVRSFRGLGEKALAGDILLVRGDKWSYLPALRSGRWKLWAFYGASRRFYPRRTWGYDVIFCDEPRHVESTRALFPQAHAARWLKTTDPGAFHPLAGAVRTWDVVCFGNMNALPKNYKALPPIVRARPNLRWLVIGTPEPTLVRELKAASPTIDFAGHVPAERANALLNACGVGLILSEQDGAPRTILESMAAGLPQIVNSRLVAGTAYVRADAGELAPIETFATTIDAVLADRERFDPAAAFRREFSPQAAADAFLAAVTAAWPTAGAHRTPFRQRWWHSLLGAKINSGHWRRRGVDL